MFGHRPRYRRRRLRGVKPVHRDIPGKFDAAAIGKLPRVPERRRMGEEKIRIERHNHPGLIEMILRLDNLPKGQPRSLAHIVARHRLPLAPFRARICRQQRLQLAVKRRRRDALRQDAKLCAAIRLHRWHHDVQRVQEHLPIARLPRAQHRLGAVGIVKVEHARLHENIRRAEAARVVRIPLDLRRTPFVAGRDCAEPESAQGQRCRKI